MSEQTTTCPCPRCGAGQKSEGNPEWVCGSYMGIGARCVSLQADPPKDAGRGWCISCGEWRGEGGGCLCQSNPPATVTNAAGGKQPEPSTYPFVHITVTRGPDAGKMIMVDIYDVIASIGCKNVAQMQALKKLMRGGRDGKDWARDMKEAADSIQRAIEMEG
jgi:hypothetical protein